MRLQLRYTSNLKDVIQGAVKLRARGREGGWVLVSATAESAKLVMLENWVARVPSRN